MPTLCVCMPNLCVCPHTYSCSRSVDGPDEEYGLSAALVARRGGGGMDGRPAKAAEAATAEAVSKRRIEDLNSDIEASRTALAESVGWVGVGLGWFSLVGM